MPISRSGIEYIYEGSVIVDSVLFDRGHMIRRWADGIARNFSIFVKEEAPLNKRGNTGHGPPGGLKAGLGTFVERVGPKHLVTSVFSEAPYTRYVAEGTGPIMATGGGAMKLPLNGAPYAPTYRNPKNAIRDLRRGYSTHKVVSGQTRNRFFDRAYVRLAARHPSLQGALSNAFRASF